VNRRPLLFFLIVAIGLFAIATTWLGNRMKDLAEATRALAPREFQGLTVVFVGTGGSHPNPMRRGPAIAVGSDTHVALVDAGRGVAEGLRASGIPTGQPGAVYLSSLLPENTVGLDDLLYAGWLDARTQPLRVVGPTGTRALVEGILAAQRAGAEGQAKAWGLAPEGIRVDVAEVAAPLDLEQGVLRVRATPLRDGPTPACVYRFERGKASVVAVGAAWDEETLVEAARGARLLIQEAHFAESIELAIEAGASEPERLRREARWRTPLADAGRRARRAGVRSLALVRLRPPPLFNFQASQPAAEAYSGKVVVPQDGDEIELTP
jgi:ribonuclease Z